MPSRTRTAAHTSALGLALALALCWAPRGAASASEGDEGWPTAHSNISAPLTASTTIVGMGASFGTVVLGVGDIDGDGRPDVVVSAPEYENSGKGQGLYVLYGPGDASLAGQTLNLSALIDGARGHAVLPVNLRSGLGESLAALGDVDGDGLRDWAATHTYISTGTAWVFTGARQRPGVPSRGVESAAAWKDMSPVNGVVAGLVAGLGDVNGDSRPEALALWLGTDTVLALGPNRTTELPVAANTSITSVAAAGDVDADGLDDLLVGVKVGGVNAVYLVWGRSGPFDRFALPGEDSVLFYSENNTRWRGLVLTGAGDFNGDSFSDVAIGDPVHTLPDASGRVYVILGGPRSRWTSGVPLDSVGSTIAGVAFDGPVASWTGEALAGGFDWNGDALSDIAIGDSQGNGRVYIVFGRRAAWPSSAQKLDAMGSPDVRVLHGVVEGGEFGASLSAAGDFNGDNVDDLLVGAPRPLTRGAAHIAYGHRLPRANRSIQSQPGCCTATVGRPFSFALAPDSFARSTSPPVELSVSSAAPWLSFDAATRTLSGTPSTGGDVGLVNVTVTARDAKGFWGRQMFHIAVAPAAADGPHVGAIVGGVVGGTAAVASVAVLAAVAAVKCGLFAACSSAAAPAMATGAVGLVVMAAAFVAHIEVRMLDEIGDNEPAPRGAPEASEDSETLASPTETLREVDPPIKDLEKIVESMRPCVGKCLKRLASKAEGIAALPTEDEALALLLYTTETKPSEESIYFRLNKHLRKRGGGGHREEGGSEQQWMRFARYLVRAMRAMPGHAGVVYRGVRCRVDRRAYAVGRRVCWRAFSSTSPSERVAASFIRDGGHCTLFEVNALRGRRITAFNMFGEDEVLLEPSSEFEVVRVVPRQGEAPCRVVLQEVAPSTLLVPLGMPAAAVLPQATQLLLS
eukprot:m51a1_g5855 hypothetical protein (914) ;mRNA; r:357142-359992